MKAYQLYLDKIYFRWGDNAYGCCSGRTELRDVCQGLDALQLFLFLYHARQFEQQCVGSRWTLQDVLGSHSFRAFDTI